MISGLFIYPVVLWGLSFAFSGKSGKIKVILELRNILRNSSKYMIR